MNGARITSGVELEGGEEIRIGGTVFRCSLNGPAPATVVSPAPPSGEAQLQAPADPEVNGEAEAPAPPTSGAERQGLGRSTVQRIVQEAILVEDRKMRRSILVAYAVGALGVVAAVAVGALFATGTIGGGGSGGPSVAALERATVLIEGLDTDGNVEYIGSGSIIRRDGIILTNAHVGAPKSPGLDVQYGVGTSSEAAPAALRIALFQGEAKPAKPLYFAKLLAADGYVDAAVLEIDKTLDGKPIGNLDLPTVRIGDSSAIRDGQQVTVVGYPGVGGGFERAINVSRGAVSGFQQDTHITSTTRGWIKTDAAIAHGNSGGLAADSSGRLIGIPSRIQCGSSLSTPCTPGQDTQGKIRPVALALPVIRAAEAGNSWTSPYVAKATGNEKFSLTGWAADQPDKSCTYKSVNSYPAEASSIVGVFSASGFAPGEDISFLAFYAPNKNAQLQRVDQIIDRWPKTGITNFSCYWAAFTANSGPGYYAIQVFAGPNLRPVSRLEVIALGSPG